MSNYVTRRFVTFLLDQFERLPLIKSIYSPVKDLVTLFGNQDAKSKMKRVVWVEFDPHSGKRLGLVTREHFSDLGLENDTKDLIAVFIPLSFMLGGYTVLVHKSKIKETNIPVDKALKLGITGWIHLEKDKKEQKS
ncbi:MAG: DUF502 domain-containing protein [Halobacteriovoraceae bacterium]|nr:DUF502 domain-containing protein [Halobacteriovoraceae bacterium]MCB9095469.1 DUF502 domain-containing protein [Halobacteriovoraceae bacterium]